MNHLVILLLFGILGNEVLNLFLSPFFSITIIELWLIIVDVR